MKKHHAVFTAMICSLGALAVSPAYASTAVDFGTPTSFSTNGGISNAAATYTAGLYTFSAYGYSCSATTPAS